MLEYLPYINILIAIILLANSGSNVEVAKKEPRLDRVNFERTLNCVNKWNFNT